MNVAADGTKKRQNTGTGWRRRTHCTEAQTTHRYDRSRTNLHLAIVAEQGTAESSRAAQQATSEQNNSVDQLIEGVDGTMNS